MSFNEPARLGNTQVFSIFFRKRSQKYPLNIAALERCALAGYIRLGRFRESCCGQGRAVVEN
jgi:hypothetical protein